MPPQNLNPQYSQWLQDFFMQQDYLPTLYQGMPAYHVEPPAFSEEYDDSGIERANLYNDANSCYIAGGVWENGTCIFPRTDADFETPVPMGGPLYSDMFSFMGISEDLRPPEGIISDYPVFKEKYEVLDYMMAGAKTRGAAETERFKLQDLLESVQTTGPDGLRVGGVSRELENQRGIINEGLVDLEAKKAFGLKAQELELAQDVYDLRRGHEQQATTDYLSWLQDYTEPPEDCGYDSVWDDVSQECRPLEDWEYVEQLQDVGDEDMNEYISDVTEEAFSDTSCIANWTIACFGYCGGGLWCDVSECAERQC